MRFMPQGGHDSSRSGSVFKFLGFASIMSSCWHRRFLSLWVFQPAPAFFSMAELPAPLGPVGPVEVAEEPVAGAVPANAEMEPPP